MKRLTTIQDIDAYMYQLNETVQVPENTKLIVKLTESEYDQVLKTIGSTNFNNGSSVDGPKETYKWEVLNFKEY